MQMLDVVSLLAALLVLMQFATIGLAAIRCRGSHILEPAPDPAPGITLVRPLCGIEDHSIETLAASLRLNYPAHEVLFCVAEASDPIVPLVKSALRAHPEVDARLLIGVDRVGANPKLNNMAKGWREARYDWVCFADSNLLAPVDYLQRLLACWGPGVGAVSAPPAGARPVDFWGEFECAFLNTFEARWQYAVDTLGQGFCQGKTLFLNKSLLRGRGIAALADEPAEDAALTKVVRAQGLHVRLAGPPFAQPLGPRAAPGVWTRQVRWARLRRATFPFLYTPEIVLGFLPAAIALAFVADAHGWSIAACLSVLFIAWYGAEAGLAALAGWPLSLKSIAAWVLRDLSMPALWCAAWAGDGFTWHGAQLSASDEPREVEAR